MRPKIVCLLALALALGGMPSRAATARHVACSEPGGRWGAATPQQTGFDAAKLADAVNFAMQRDTFWFKVIRYGCLVAQEPWAPEGDQAYYESFSMAKSVVAMAVGRLVALGKLRLDDPIGRYLKGSPYTPDPAHAAITVRHLLTMTSGLHWNFFRDYNAFTIHDHVADALSLPIDHRPGTYFEYHQEGVSLLARVVQQAAHREFQDFVQRELFGPIGIPAGSWTWTRDGAGNTAGFYGLRMPALQWARLGELMLRNGAWGRTHLLDAGFVAAVQSPGPHNSCYGFLFWLNRDASPASPCVNPTIYARDSRAAGRPIASAPSSLYTMDGLFDQNVFVVPALHLVVVRIGMNGAREADTRSTVWTSSQNEFDHELWRRLGAAITDAPRGVIPPDPGPYDAAQSAVPTIDSSHGIVGSAAHPEEWIVQPQHGIPSP